MLFSTNSNRPFLGSAKCMQHIKGLCKGAITRVHLATAKEPVGLHSRSQRKLAYAPTSLLSESSQITHLCTQFSSNISPQVIESIKRGISYHLLWVMWTRQYPLEHRKMDKHSISSKLQDRRGWATQNEKYIVKDEDSVDNETSCGLLAHAQRLSLSPKIC